MSILIELSITTSEWDGVTFVPAADWTFTQGPRDNHFIGTLADGLAAGIVDYAEILQALRVQFGDFVDRKSLHAGSRALVTDLLLERIVFVTESADAPGSTCGTHSPPDLGGPNLAVRLRSVPELMATETVGTLQGGGAGQVSHTALANGQSGLVLIPTGMRWFVESNVGVAGDQSVLVWLVPVASPLDVAQLAGVAAMPAPVFA